MSGATASYSFLSWARRGLANAATSAPSVGSLRPELSVEIDIETDLGTQVPPVTRTVGLIGPGDIIGISPGAIIRKEPDNWVKDFLPNYFPFIEFYDEDFPWRHSPGVPNTSDQLPPWIALVVLADGAFTEVPGSAPLPAIETKVEADSVFPLWDQLWAWAHIQANAAIGTDPTGAALPRAQAAAQLEALVSANPDLACARILCPIKLAPRTSYHAFLVPTYESGRRAGLGEVLDQPAINATTPAWGSGQKRFPYYHRWEFGTASRGDFEYLVGLLEPRRVDPRVGTRDMHVADQIDRVAAPSRPVLALEGALCSPQTVPTPWPGSAYPDPFQQDLATFINLADGLQLESADPVITPPLYGRWHALHPKLSTVSEGGANPYDHEAKWITELNLDPRHRAAAGIGALVVQENQERLMNDAWWQVGDILEANRQIRIGQLAAAASNGIYSQTILAGSDEAVFQLTQQVHPQIMGSEETIHFKVRASPVPAGILSPTYRRMLRPRGKIARAAFPAAERRPQTQLIARINREEISHSPPRPQPAGAMTLANLAAKIAPAPTGLAGRLPKPLSRLLIAILKLTRSALRLAALVLPFAAPVLKPPIAAIRRAIAALEAPRLAARMRSALQESNFMPQAVAAMPTNAGFRITAPDEGISFSPGGADSVQSTRFKSALLGISQQFAVEGPVQQPTTPLDLAHLYQAVRNGVDPWISLPTRMRSYINMAGWRQSDPADTFVPIGAYPIFDQPMYEAVRDLSTDYLIPNIQLVPDNTVALLKENRRFIEAYMVGLNHEMARECNWRGYPLLDFRGSFFRQFWDVRDRLKPANVTDAAWIEQSRDIPEIHGWSRHAALGDHPNHATATAQDKLVLLLRGQLLLRFRNVVIYAHRAKWQLDSNGQPDTGKPRALAPSGAANERYPLYSASVAPDVTFLGFDLTVSEAKGGTSAGSDAGWFFAIKQRPGETLFGLDIEDSKTSTPLLHWDDLTWEDLGGVTNGHIVLPPAAQQIVPTASAVIRGQTLAWSDASNAAAIAAITYQDPVLVAVHAKEMLPV